MNNINNNKMITDITWKDSLVVLLVLPIMSSTSLSRNKSNFAIFIFFWVSVCEASVVTSVSVNYNVFLDVHSHKFEKTIKIQPFKLFCSLI